MAGWALLAAAAVTAAVLILAPEVASAGYGALVLVVCVGIALMASVVYVNGSSGAKGSDDA
jgi:hypothetical protein